MITEPTPQSLATALLPDWLAQVLSSLRLHIHCVLITVVQTEGSAPREAGTRMVVMADGSLSGTIGGGTLEYQAIGHAHTLLTSHAPEPSGHLQCFILGPDLGQCCGGVVTLHFECLSHIHHSPWPEQLAALLSAGKPGVLYSHPAENVHHDRAARNLITAPVADMPIPDIALEAATAAGHYVLREYVRPHDFHIVLYGAGHVGQALVSILANLPCRVHWVDQRPQQFPQQRPANVTVYPSPEPVTGVADMPAGSYYLIMTHDHALDLELCARVLAREDIRFLGLIGSKTKAARFRHRLLQRGISPEQLKRLTCPVGISGIHDKHPAAIAVAIVAQLLLEQSNPASAPNRRQDTDEYSPTPS